MANTVSEERLIEAALNWHAVPEDTDKAEEDLDAACEAHLSARNAIAPVTVGSQWSREEETAMRTVVEVNGDWLRLDGDVGEVSAEWLRKFYVPRP